MDERWRDDKDGGEKKKEDNDERIMIKTRESERDRYERQIKYIRRFERKAYKFKLRDRW